MKRVIVCPILIILLCGCTLQKQVSPIVDNISFTADIHYEDQNYVCEVTALENALNLTVTEPDVINGLSLQIDKNSLTAEFKGIEYASDANVLPESAVVVTFYKILKDVAGETIEVANENCEISGTIDDSKYLFTFSPSGLPISLEIDNIDMNIKFSNVTLK